MSTEENRCPWCLGHDLYVKYHDEDWGVPVHDDRELFEKLILDGAQAGLSWLTILKKRDSYRRAYQGFNIERVARYTEQDESRLLQDAGIVRNRLKIRASILNAQATLALQKEFGSLDAFLWSFVGGRTIQNHCQSMADLPARSLESDAMSKALLKRGFKFVGSTICYAFMQAVGMVNDHLVTCARHKAVAKLS